MSRKVSLAVFNALKAAMGRKLAEAESKLAKAESKVEKLTEIVKVLSEKNEQKRALLQERDAPPGERDDVIDGLCKKIGLLIDSNNALRFQLGEKRTGRRPTSVEEVVCGRKVRFELGTK